MLELHALLTGTGGVFNSDVFLVTLLASMESVKVNVGMALTLRDMRLSVSKAVIKPDDITSVITVNQWQNEDKHLTQILQHLVFMTYYSILYETS